MTSNMLPFSQEKQSLGNYQRFITTLLPEGLLITITVLYYFAPLLIWKETFLITRPILSTTVFVIIYGVIQSIIFCHVWEWCKSHQNQEYGNLVNNKKSGKALRSLGICIASFCICHTMCVLFGAALTKNVLETATWALLASTLITIPNICIFGSNLEPWYRIIVCGKYTNHLEQLLYFQCLGVTIGSWSSAVVIPLDWDRNWQVWPIPCIIGCLSGYIVSLCIHCIFVVRDVKRMKRS